MNKMKKITRYIVEIGYRKFAFSDLEQACIFAETAVRASLEETEAEIHIYTENPEAENVDVR